MFTYYFPLGSCWTTMTGSFFASCVAGIVPSSSPDKFSLLAELILSGGDDQLQHFGGALVRDFRVRLVVPSELAPFRGLSNQLLLRVAAYFDRADLVEATVHEFLGGQCAAGLQPVNDRAYAG